MNTNSDFLAIASILIALVSVIVAFSAYRLNTRQTSGELIYRIIERLEAKQMREIRKTIYGLERDKYLEWDDEIHLKVDIWGAELDIVSTILQGEANKVAFFQLYGDVVLRSIYQIAPYANYQRTIRGRQFLLPLESFGCHVLDIWKRLAKKDGYPLVIGLPNRYKSSLSYNTFTTDRDCQNFLQK